MMKFVCDRVDYIMGKEENAGYQHFLLFPQCYKKNFPHGQTNLGMCSLEFVMSILICSSITECQ